MATYKEIHGTVIETVTSDPSNPVNGQVWYNSTDQVLKGFTSNPAGSWASGGNLNTGIAIKNVLIGLAILVGAFALFKLLAPSTPEPVVITTVAQAIQENATEVITGIKPTTLGISSRGHPRQ